MASKRWGDPGDLTRSWRNDPGPAFMPPVKQLNGLAAARSRQRGWDCWADGDYARVIALGSSPYHDIPAVI